MVNPEIPNAKKSQLVRETRKKPYQKPEFRFERVFETRALSCGKTGTQAQCQLNPKNS
jgi:hypothetical protein